MLSPQTGMTAVAWISIFARSSTRRDDLHRRHGREMPADDVSIDMADAFEIADILLPIGKVPCHGGDMLGLGSGHGQHIDDVLQRLPDLLYKIVRFELALCIPTDLAADENLAARRGNAVGVADRLGPSLRLQDRVHWFSPDFR